VVFRRPKSRKPTVKGDVPTGGVTGTMVAGILGICAQAQAGRSRRAAAKMILFRMMPSF
jgi:hypothetical protein